MHSSWKAIGLAAVLGTGVTYSWLHSNDSAAGPTAVYAQQKADAQQAQSHLMASADQLSAAFREVAKSLKPGQSGTIEIKGWVSPNRMEPIKGIETPADDRDSFVGP